MLLIKFFPGAIVSRFNGKSKPKGITIKRNLLP
jgi:hypothetical protein